LSGGTETRPLRRILCVEDDRDIRTIVTLALETVGGYAVRCCSSGSEALEVGPGFAPDLILLDVMMPGMDGPETLLELRKDPSMSPVPVVFMTARAERGDELRYLSLGAIDTITKPFDPLTLPDSVREIWRRHVEPR
jgi:CheY-like chemotaxis protein